MFIRIAAANSPFITGLGLGQTTLGVQAIFPDQSLTWDDEKTGHDSVMPNGFAGRKGFWGRSGDATVDRLGAVWGKD